MTDTEKPRCRFAVGDEVRFINIEASRLDGHPGARLDTLYHVQSTKFHPGHYEGYPRGLWTVVVAELPHQLAIQERLVLWHQTILPEPAFSLDELAEAEKLIEQLR